MSEADVAASIPRHTADDAGRLDFAALRREGLDHVRDLAGLTWTDYNLHDPGIALLEALCFALTEVVYRSDAEVPELLRDAQGRLDLERQGLMPAASALPCRASTLEDYRALLLDRLPELADVQFTADSRGLLHLCLHLRGNARSQGAEPLQGPALPRQRELRQQARELYRLHRTLGEDLHDVIDIVSEHPCTLAGDIEIEGARDPAAILAEVYHRCARHICAPVLLRRIDERLAAGEPPDEVFVGPATRVQPRSGPATAQALPQHLHVSDLAIQLRGVPGVRRVNDLWLDEVGKAPNRRVLRWRGPNWVLTLDVPRPGQALAGVQLRRRGSAVVVDPNALCEEYAQLEAQERALTARTDLPVSPREPVLARWPTVHYSVQHHLPPTYGLGDHGSLAGVDSTRRAHVAQLRAYLALFDQVLAHLGEQWRHVRDLYTAEGTAEQAEGAPGPTHWWQMLDDRNQIVPGIEALYTKDVETLRREIYEARDARVDRRHRVLDEMLALYGQTLAQNTARQFLARVLKDDTKVEHRLLADKAAFLHLTLHHGADRAGGFDYGKAPDRAANCSGLERVLPLLLGFGPEERCHVVEHVLLRARSDARAEPAPHAQRRGRADADDRFALRVSVVFPKATSLTSQPSFAAFAQETVQLNLPAHVLGRCLWLDADALTDFESAHEAWLEKLRAFADDPAPANAVPLDEASRKLQAQLDRHRPVGG